MTQGAVFIDMIISCVSQQHGLAKRNTEWNNDSIWMVHKLLKNEQIDFIQIYTLQQLYTMVTGVTYLAITIIYRLNLGIISSNGICKSSAVWAWIKNAELSSSNDNYRTVRQKTRDYINSCFSFCTHINKRT